MNSSNSFGEILMMLAEGVKFLPGYTEFFEMGDMFYKRPEMKVEDGVATIHVQNFLARKPAPIAEKSGAATSYGAIRREVQLAREQGAEAFLFVHDSPGGTVEGNVELADFVATMPEPTASHAEGLMGSASYKIAAGCDYITAERSATVGGIGTICTIRQPSEWGGKLEVITSAGADLKSIGAGKLTDDQRAFLKERVDEMGAQFRAHVSANRDVSPEVFRGGVYSGAKAIELGLVDATGGRDIATGYLKTRI